MQSCPHCKAEWEGAASVGLVKCAACGRFFALRKKTTVESSPAVPRPAATGTPATPRPEATGAPAAPRPAATEARVVTEAASQEPKSELTSVLLDLDAYAELTIEDGREAQTKAATSPPPGRTARLLPAASKVAAKQPADAAPRVVAPSRAPAAPPSPSPLPPAPEEDAGEVFASRFGFGQGDEVAGPSLPKPLRLGESGLPAPLVETETTDPEIRVPAGKIPGDGSSAAVLLAHVRESSAESWGGLVHGVAARMVGRERLLSALMGAFDTTAREHRCRVVQVYGPAGIGKSRLVFEHFEELRCLEKPFTLLTSFRMASPAHRADLIQRLLASRLRLPLEASVEEKRRVLGERARELFEEQEVAWAVQVLTALYSLPTPEIVERKVQALRSDRAALRRAARELVESLVRREAKLRPVVMWLDHLQGDDADGLIEVCEMLAKLRELPLVAIMVASDAEVIPIDRLDVANVPVLPIEVRALDDASMADLVRDILRRAEHIPEDFLNLLVRKAQGLPLALEQIIRLLVDIGIIDTTASTWRIEFSAALDEDALPSSIEGLAQLRMEALNEDQRHVLTVAALLGRAFRLDDLVNLLTLEPMAADEVPWFVEAREGWTRQVLAQLVHDEIIQARVESTEATAFEFKFESEQRLLQAHANPVLARTVHGCYARMLATRDVEQSQVALHLEAAGLWKEAAQQWIAVGKTAERAFFNHSALDTYTHVLELLGPEDGLVFIEALFSAGRVAIRVGEYKVAERIFANMLQTSFALREMKHSILAYRYLGLAQRCNGRNESAETSQRRGLDLAERAEDPALIAGCLDDLAMTAFEGGAPGAFAEALKMLERALEIRRSLGNSADTAETLDRLGMVLIGRGDLNRAMAILSEALNLRLAADAWSGMAQTKVSIARVMRKLGHSQGIERHLDEAMAVVDRSGEVWMRHVLASLLAEDAVTDGKLEEARHHLAQARELLERLPCLPWKIEMHRISALLVLREGRLPEALREAIRATELARAGESRLRLGGALVTLAEILAEVLKQAYTPKPSPKQIRDIFLEALAFLEEMGNWHGAAMCLRSYGRFLLERGKKAEYEQCRIRADKLDPLTQ